MIFSMRNRFRRPRGDPPRRGHKCALRPPNAAICYESATFANWKTRAQKSDKNEKMFSKKWNLHPSAAIRAPSSASLKKGCLEHSKNAGFYKVSTTLQRETRCAWICSKLLRFCKVFLMKKKVEKSEIEQNICVLLIRMEKRVTEPQFLSQMILGHQITTTKSHTWGLMVLQRQNEG